MRVIPVVPLDMARDDFSSTLREIMGLDFPGCYCVWREHIYALLRTWRRGMWLSFFGRCSVNISTPIILVAFCNRYDHLGHGDSFCGLRNIWAR